MHSPLSRRSRCRSRMSRTGRTATTRSRSPARCGRPAGRTRGGSGRG
jgi:hypothetical protein